jgi:hypothetical protein
MQSPAYSIIGDTATPYGLELNVKHMTTHWSGFVISKSRVLGILLGLRERKDLSFFSTFHH